MNTQSRDRTPCESLIIVKGAGDLATGIIHRLWRSGFLVIATEIENPTMVRRTVSFAECLYSKHHTVEGVMAVQAEGTTTAEKLSASMKILDAGSLPITIDPDGEIVPLARPTALVDAIMAKENLGTRIDQAEVVVGIGPGFNAGVDVHAIIETARGHDIGRVILDGKAEPNTGVPGPIGGYTMERLLRSPTAGTFKPYVAIGDLVRAGDVVAVVGRTAVKAEISGVIRGLLREGIEVKEGYKVGDVDPRAKVSHCHTISDKSRSVGGGVLEAIMMFLFGVKNSTGQKR